ncbi:hypothetical protein GCM10009737_30190 [Nocardioides lentus]|uniref:DUF3017 domain-containing protein n=1 Tax=Nocardioides lentus TaxID=338077 RepID=A0ABN2PMS8_9ACTN
MTDPDEAPPPDEASPGDGTSPPGGGDEPDEEPRRYPSTIGGALYLVVLAVTAAGVVVAGIGPWRTGLRVVAGALVAAALLRLALRTRDAGMLAVRHRAFDAALLLALGGAIVFLTSSIPDQPL